MILFFLFYRHLVPPPPPANVTYSNIEETKVHVYWDPPELHEMFSIEQYYIAYRRHGDQEWANVTFNAKLNGITNFKINDLESDTFYILRIFAWNAYGLGKESQKMEIKTKKVEGMHLYLRPSGYQTPVPE